MAHFPLTVLSLLSVHSTHRVISWDAIRSLLLVLSPRLTFLRLCGFLAVFVSFTRDGSLVNRDSFMHAGLLTHYDSLPNLGFLLAVGSHLSHGYL